VLLICFAAIPFVLRGDDSGGVGRVAKQKVTAGVHR
jgi:hypothetical protein